jgi:hypothetical protein
VTGTDVRTSRKNRYGGADAGKDKGGTGYAGGTL